MVGGGKRGPSDPFVCVRERERERERASGMIWSRRSAREKKKKEKWRDEMLEKKRKKKEKWR